MDTELAGGFQLGRIPFHFYMLHSEGRSTLEGVVSYDLRCHIAKLIFPICAQFPHYCFCSDLPASDWQYLEVLGNVWEESPVEDEGGQLLTQAELVPAREKCLLQLWAYSMHDQGLRVNN